MPTGLQVMLGGTATTQITNEDVYFSLFRKGIVTSQATWSQEGGNSAYYDLTVTGVTMEDEPMLALRCTGGTWHEVISNAANSVTWRIYRTGGGDVLWYLFTAKSPEAITFGLELYDINGQVIFNSGHPIARPLGVFANGNYSGIDLAGRTLAHVPMKMSYYSYRLVTYRYPVNMGGYDQYWVFQQTGWSRSAISINNQTIAEQFRSMNIGPIPTHYQMSMPLTVPNQSSSQEYASLILDVTYY